MITSKQILFLGESYFTLSKNYKGLSYPVYLNPTSSDYVEMEKNVRGLKNPQYKKLYSVRFIADLVSQKLYVADGYLSLHSELLRAVSPNMNNCIYGEAACRGGKPIIWYVNSDYPDFVTKSVDVSNVNSNRVPAEFKKRFLSSKYIIWLEQYFDLSNLKKYGIYGKEN